MSALSSVDEDSNSDEFISSKPRLVVPTSSSDSTLLIRKNDRRSRKSTSASIFLSGHVTERLRTLASKAPSFSKHAGSASKALLKPLRIPDSHVTWCGFLHWRMSSTASSKEAASSSRTSSRDGGGAGGGAFERRFAMVCGASGALVLSSRAPHFHADPLYQGRSCFLVAELASPAGKLEVLELQSVRRLSVPRTRTGLYVAALPDTVELFCASSSSGGGGGGGRGGSSKSGSGGGRGGVPVVPWVALFEDSGACESFARAVGLAAGLTPGLTRGQTDGDLTTASTPTNQGSNGGTGYSKLSLPPPPSVSPIPQRGHSETKRKVASSSSGAPTNSGVVVVVVPLASVLWRGWVSVAIRVDTQSSEDSVVKGGAFFAKEQEERAHVIGNLVNNNDDNDADDKGKRDESARHGPTIFKREGQGVEGPTSSSTAVVALKPFSRRHQSRDHPPRSKVDDDDNDDNRATSSSSSSSTSSSSSPQQEQPPPTRRRRMYALLLDSHRLVLSSQPPRASASASAPYSSSTTTDYSHSSSSSPPPPPPSSSRIKGTSTASALFGVATATAAPLPSEESDSLSLVCHLDGPEYGLSLTDAATVVCFEKKTKESRPQAEEEEGTEEAVPPPPAAAAAVEVGVGSVVRLDPRTPLGVRLTDACVVTEVHEVSGGGSVFQEGARVVWCAGQVVRSKAELKTVLSREASRVATEEQWRRGEVAQERATKVEGLSHGDYKTKREEQVENTRGGEGVETGGGGVPFSADEGDPLAEAWRMIELRLVDSRLRQTSSGSSSSSSSSSGGDDEPTNESGSGAGGKMRGGKEEHGDQDEDEDEDADDDEDDSPVLRVTARRHCNVAPTDEDEDGGELAASFQGVCLHSYDIFVDRAAKTGRRINPTKQLFDSCGDSSLTKAATEGGDATTAAATAREGGGGGGGGCRGGEMPRFLSTSQMILKTRLAEAEIPTTGTKRALRQAVVGLRRKAGCHWRRVPRQQLLTQPGSTSNEDGGSSSSSSSSSNALVSAATGRASLWRSAAAAREVQSSSASLAQARSRLAQLPAVSFVVVKHHSATSSASSSASSLASSSAPSSAPSSSSSSGRGKRSNKKHLPRVLTVTSECVQRLAVVAVTSAEGAQTAADHERGDGEVLRSSSYHHHHANGGSGGGGLGTVDLGFDRSGLGGDPGGLAYLGSQEFRAVAPFDGAFESTFEGARAQAWLARSFDSISVHSTLHLSHVLLASSSTSPSSLVAASPSPHAKVVGGGGGGASLQQHQHSPVGIAASGGGGAPIPSSEKCSSSPPPPAPPPPPPPPLPSPASSSEEEGGGLKGKRPTLTQEGHTLRLEALVRGGGSAGGRLSLKRWYSGGVSSAPSSSLTSTASTSLSPASASSPIENNSASRGRGGMSTGRGLHRRVFQYSTPHAQEVEAEVNVRLNLRRLVSQLSDPQRIALSVASAAQVTARPQTSADDLTDPDPAAAATATAATSTFADQLKVDDVKKRLREALLFLYGPPGSSSHTTSPAAKTAKTTVLASSSSRLHTDCRSAGEDNELWSAVAVSKTVAEAINSFADRAASAAAAAAAAATENEGGSRGIIEDDGDDAASAGAGNGLEEGIPGFLADFVDYLVDRFWVTVTNFELEEEAREIKDAARQAAEAVRAKHANVAREKSARALAALEAMGVANEDGGSSSCTGSGGGGCSRVDQSSGGDDIARALRRGAVEMATTLSEEDEAKIEAEAEAAAQAAVAALKPPRGTSAVDKNMGSSPLSPPSPQLLWLDLRLREEEVGELRVQLHRLLVDSLVVPLLGPKLWADCLMRHQPEDDAFHAGLWRRTHATKASRSRAMTTMAAVMPERNIDWQEAARSLGDLERTMNPSDQLEVIKRSVDVITRPPLTGEVVCAPAKAPQSPRPSPPPLPPPPPSLSGIRNEQQRACGDEQRMVVVRFHGESGVGSDGAEEDNGTAAPKENQGALEDHELTSGHSDEDEVSKKRQLPLPPEQPPSPLQPPPELPPISADELIPAFITVVALTAAVETAETAEVPQRQQQQQSSEGGQEALTSLLAPSSTLAYMRALLHPQLLVAEPGFLLALFEGAVYHLSHPTNSKTAQSDVAAYAGDEGEVGSDTVLSGCVVAESDAGTEEDAGGGGQGDGAVVVAASGAGFDDGGQGKGGGGESAKEINDPIDKSGSKVTTTSLRRASTMYLHLASSGSRAPLKASIRSTVSSSSSSMTMDMRREWLDGEEEASLLRSRTISSSSSSSFGSTAPNGGSAFDVLAVVGAAGSRRESSYSVASRPPSTVAMKIGSPTADEDSGGDTESAVDEVGDASKAAAALNSSVVDDLNFVDVEYASSSDDEEGPSPQELLPIDPQQPIGE